MESTQWFYLKKGQQRGPVDTGDLTSLIHSGVLPPDTLVFTNTQADWIPANTTGVFPLKAATLTAGSNTFKRCAIAGVVLLFLMLGSGLLVMQQKQSAGKSMNDLATLNEDDRVRGKFQFDAAQSGPRKNTAEQNNSEKLQSNRQWNFGNRQPFADDGTLQIQLALLQRQYASLEAERRAAEKRAKSEIATARKNESRNDDQLAEVNIARLQLEQSLEDSRKQVADLNRQIKTMENQSQLGNMTNDDLAASKKTRLQLEQRLAAARLLNANLLRRVKQMEANSQQDSHNNAGLTAQLRKASKELETARKTISGLQQQPKDANTPASNTPKRNRPQRIPMVPANAVGNIKYVDTLSKFIVINRGSENGINSGDVFSIISRSTGKFLGRITITRIRPSFAGGTLNGQGIDRLQTGDLLFR